MGKQKVITVRGDRTKWYDKVIFVVKNEDVLENIDLLFEAEKIVSEYMLSQSMPYTKKNINTEIKSINVVENKKDPINTFLYFAIGLAVFTLLYLILFNW